MTSKVSSAPRLVRTTSGWSEGDVSGVEANRQMEAPRRQWVAASEGER